MLLRFEPLEECYAIDLARSDDSRDAIVSNTTGERFPTSCSSSSSSSARPAPMLVVHSPQTSLHAPQHELLSGTLQPYFESPERPRVVLDALLSPPTPFKLHEESWSLEELEHDWFTSLLREVHTEEYLEFLKTIHQRWIKEGGNHVSSRSSRSLSAAHRSAQQDAALPETFLRQDLLLEEDRGSSLTSAIELVGASTRLMTYSVLC